MTPFRIAVSSKIEDARARNILHTLKSLYPEARLERVATAAAYTIDAKLTTKELERSAKRLTNSVTETSSIESVSRTVLKESQGRSLVTIVPEKWSYALEIGYLPGVTDNVGHTVQETIEDCTGRTFREGEAVYSSLFIFLYGALGRNDVEKFARELHNPLIERATIFEARSAFPIVVPKVALHEHTGADLIDLNVGDSELLKISREGIAGRGPLALSLAAMKVIRDHFRKLKRDPTDVELESLAQTWSEHCKHTIFNDPLDEVKEGIYRRYIKGATEKIREQSTANRKQKDFCVSVFKDNSGAIAFDKDYLITHKVETHNAPSALDPFGGSVTAIVGVNRDALGFGLGAKPIANVYGFCVADPTDTSKLFRDKAKKQPLLPARRILEGVVRGINAGGNESGIPTPLGFVAVDPSYRGKPLVFGGTVGLIPRFASPKPDGRRRVKLYEKCAKPGDYIVMLGGRVGLDGVHGATFSSEALSKGSPATAVQIGDPITQKKLSDALIREARDAGLYTSITDNGAGGLSGAVGEMARDMGGPSPRRSGLSPRRSLRRSAGRPREGGCVVDLEKVPLKYQGLSPWQIWISESQERMTLAVPKKHWSAFKKIMERYDVEASIIGTFTDSGRCVVRMNGKKVMDLSLEFLHEGRPITTQKSEKHKGPAFVSYKGRSFVSGGEIEQAILAVLARPSIGSISFISQQYDHEVQSSSVTKPLHGRGRVNADSAVLRPRPDSKRGVVLAHGYCPWYSEIDTYAMAAAAIDTAVRNAVCAGASRDHLALLDNFCWSSSEKPERLYELKQAAKACYDIATAYGTPFISGKDSMFNDFKGFDANGKPIHIAALPTLLISAIGVIPDIADAQTIDFKRAGDFVYIIGETNDELGGSEYERLTKSFMGDVPHVDAAKNAKAYDAVSRAIRTGLVASAIGVGRGGFAVALAKSAIAGQLGVRVNLNLLPGGAASDEARLFSESQGRMLVSIRPDAQQEFEKLFKGIPLTNIGEVVQAASVSISLAETNIEIGLPPLTSAYRLFFNDW